ncbi:MAG TPA: hypothetical protein DDW49_05845 [Deltaproteobacteria bacterium]|nr:hypothetical protein [Deltaproteobacteria bacterium]
MVRVEGGILVPFYPPSPKEKEIPVKSFWMDKTQVTNAQFLSFVKQNPSWRRDKIKKIFADARYLSYWQTPSSLGNAKPDQPVTQISWFAAKAYCQAQDKRLPTENEWEYAAQASPRQANARKDMEWRTHVLDWYTRPAPKELPEVGKSEPNYWGLYDLHGLVWEWVLDFNSSLISSDNRENATSPDKNRFCGAGALVATEKDDYASFMRIAFRTSLKATYTTSNLGFRCAKDL